MRLPAATACFVSLHIDQIEHIVQTGVADTPHGSFPRAARSASSSGPLQASAVHADASPQCYDQSHASSHLRTPNRCGMFFHPLALFPLLMLFSESLHNDMHA